MSKSPYQDWPFESIAAELFAMRRAVIAHPEDAHRWTDRITQMEQEVHRRRMEDTPLKTFQEPFGERLARRLLASLWDGHAEPEYVDDTQDLLVAEDEYGWLWVRGSHSPAFQHIRPWQPRHARAIINSLRRRKVMMVEWE